VNKRWLILTIHPLHHNPESLCLTDTEDFNNVLVVQSPEEEEVRKKKEKKTHFMIHASFNVSVIFILCGTLIATACLRRVPFLQLRERETIKKLFLFCLAWRK
jgi:hypothetical protein